MDNEINKIVKNLEEKPRDYRIKVKAEADIFSFIYTTVISLFSFLICTQLISNLDYFPYSLLILVMLIVVIGYTLGLIMIDKIIRNKVGKIVTLKLSSSEIVNNHFSKANLSEKNKIILASAQKDILKKLWLNRTLVYGILLFVITLKFHNELRILFLYSKLYL